MPFLLMLFLTLACLPDSWSPPVVPLGTPLVCVIVAWAGVVVTVAAAGAIASRVRRLVMENRLPHEQIVRRYTRWRTRHLLGTALGYAATLYLLGYGWAIHSLWVHGGRLLPGAELLIMAPFCAALVLSWTCYYDAEKALTGEPHVEHEHNGHPAPRRFWTRAGYLGYYLRQNLALVFLPILLIVGEKEVRRQIPSLNDQWQVHAVLVGLVALSVVVAMPWILRAVLGLKPLPPGPLRDRLMATARRLNFRFSDILVWNTRSGVANAMIVGVVPWLRYVLLSDRLMEDLPADEVEAVFGHEVGHVKHHHMVCYLLFLLGSMVAIGLALLPYQEELAGYFNVRHRSDLAALPLVGALGAYIFVVFGFLSRRCERQADVYGCRAVSCGNPACADHGTPAPIPEAACGLCPTGIRTFVRALERVGELNGISRDRPGFFQSWQHSSIGRRVAFLHTLMENPSAERQFQARVFLLKCALFAVLAVVLMVEVF
jgi:Zn-dependent protease with chaperone function